MKKAYGEIRQRQAALREELKRQRLGGLFLTQREDVAYFTGYTGDDASILITKSAGWLLTDARYDEEAKASVVDFEIVMWKKHPAIHAAELVARARIRSLGVSAKHISMDWFERLTKSLARVRIEHADGIPEQIRMRKSSAEVRAIQKALRCAEEAFLEAKQSIQPGMTEMDLRLELEWAMRKRGASDTAFETIVAADANASLPHAHAGKRKLRQGGMVLIDWGAHVSGYNSDLTRVLFLGSITKFWRQQYLSVLDAQAAGIRAIRAGATGKEVDAAARAVFAERECEKHFTHSLGHGVGRQVHEMPRLSKLSETVLQPGMIVTVEPGLYYPKRGGIRIEDMVLVTENGSRVLSRLPKDLDAAVI